MDTSANSRFSGLGMEDPFCSDQFDIMDFFDEEYSSATLGDDFLISSLSPEGNSSSFSTMIPRTISGTRTLYASSSTESLPVANVSSDMEPTTVAVERPAKQVKRVNTPIILTFGLPSVPETNPQQVSLGILNYADDAMCEILTSQGSFTSLRETTTNARPRTKKSGGRVRPAAQTYDHIIAERKRREQLSQQFRALSAIVPGLKKMDKTSVLGDAITYLKHLKERVKTLEEQATKQTMESVVLVKKPQILVEDEGCLDEKSGTNGQPLPEIEAKLCDKKVLLRVHCENYKGVLVKLLSEVEKLNLAVASTSVAPFGSLAVDITIIAEMEKEFNTTMKELVRSLQAALHRVGQDMLK